MLLAMSSWEKPLLAEKLPCYFHCQLWRTQENIVRFKTGVSVTDRIQSGATTQGQSGPVSDDNKGVLCIAHSSCITDASLSDYLGS